MPTLELPALLQRSGSRCPPRSYDLLQPCVSFLSLRLREFATLASCAAGFFWHTDNIETHPSPDDQWTHEFLVAKDP